MIIQRCGLQTSVEVGTIDKDRLKCHISLFSVFLVPECAGTEKIRSDRFYEKGVFVCIQFFTSCHGNQTQDGWVGSESATSVL